MADKLLVSIVRRHTGALVLFLLVMLNIGMNFLKEFKVCIARVEVNVVVLDVFSEAFNPGVVGGSDFAIDSYVDMLGFEEVYPCRTGALRPLVGVGDFRCSVLVASLGLANAAPILERNSDFHLEMVTALISNY